MTNTGITEMDGLTKRVLGMVETAMTDAETAYIERDTEKTVNALRVLTAATESYYKLVHVSALVFLVNKETT